MNPHRTLLILKPDGYKRNLLGVVLRELEHCTRVVQIETRRLMSKDAQFLYEQHKGKDFYKPLHRFMISGPSIMVELMGNHAVSRVRKLVGEGGIPYPKHTIRGSLAAAMPRNVVHCSDSTAAAMRELAYFFPRDKSSRVRQWITL